MKHDDRERRMQELLEYVHGCHEHPQEIERRLEGDAELRALLDEAKRTAGVLERAARAPAPELVLEPPTSPPRRGQSTTKRPFWSAPRIAIAALFALLIAAPAGWWAWQETRLRDARQSGLRLVVSGPSAVPDGAPAKLRVETWDLEGNARAAELGWVAFDSENRKLGEGNFTSDGAFDLDLAAHIQGVRRVEVCAAGDGVERNASFEISPETAHPLAHLTTDKPAYRPGETVWLRAVLLRRLSLTPFDGACRLRIVDPKGAAVERWAPPLEEGVAALAWTIPEDAAGGNYALELRDARDDFTVETLPILVRRYQPPRLAKEITLDRETYRPGERGAAEVAVERVEGGIPVGARVRAALVIDGEEVWNEEGTLDAAGRALFRFVVPERVDRGDARFLARLIDGGVVETAIEAFTVPTDRLEVTFHPEGGDLVARLTSRVYVEVTDPLGRAVSVRGRVVDSKGRKITEVETVHQGRGRFEFTPKLRETYRLELDEYSDAHPLPEVKGSGVVVHTHADSTTAGEDLTATVETTSAGPWIAGVFCRGQLVAQDTFGGAGEHELVMILPDEVAGVLRLTVFDRELRPVAERLVHRASGREIDVAVTLREARLVPGAHQILDLVARDELGRPVDCTLGLAVTDRAVRDMVGDARIGLADQTWFAADVEELEDAAEFLAGDEESLRNVDLLLGTRGWRRFAWLDPEALIAEHGDEAKRLLAREGRSQVPSVLDDDGDSEALVAAARHDVRGAKQNFALFTSIAVGALVLWITWCVWSWVVRLVIGRRPIAGPALSAVLTASLFLLMFALWVPSQFGGRAAGIEFAADAVFFSERERAPAAAPAAVAWEGEEIEEEALEEGVLALGRLGYAGEQDAVEVWGMAIAGGAGEKGVFFDGLGVDAEAVDEALLAPPMEEPEPGLEELQKLGYIEEVEDEMQEGWRGDAKPRVYRRVYAHRNEREPNSNAPRTDYAETAYWNALLRTGPEGTVRVEFDLSDRVTTWNVHVDAHGTGRVGQSLASFEAITPFRMEAKLPMELTVGDELLLPVALTSGLATIETARMRADVGGPLSFIGDVGGERTVELIDGRGRVLLPIEVGAMQEGARIGLAGEAGGWTDRVIRDLRVVPRGFPQRVSKSGVVRDETEFEIAIPEGVSEGSLQLDLKLYPSPLADLLDGLDGILREPCGCFEQASSSNYPNVLALAYLEAAGADEPVIMARARELMGSGYTKIASYECSEKGYEWFGGDPGHEALTAYGLLEFADMGEVFDVDEEMVARTRAWLLGRRDGEGGFARNERALDSFGRAPQPVTDAYVTYALVVTGEGEGDLGPELDAVAERAVESDDPYEVALVASALHAAGRLEAADAARERLKTMQEEDGSLRGTTTSITSSGGSDLAVETTSLAILAWLDDEHDLAQVERAVQFLAENRSSSGTFGATQATIQALRALTSYARAKRRVAHAGEVTVYVNDYAIETTAFLAGHRGTISFPSLAEHLTPGINRIRLALTGGNEFPWACDLAYHAEQPADDPDATLAIETTLAAEEVVEGETVALTVRIHNLRDAGQPMTLAVVGLPAGLEAPTEVLEDLAEAERFDLWEIRGRELILYWRDMPPEGTREVVIDLLARIPGRTTGPASRAYLYYTPGAKRWSEPLTVRILPVQ